MKKKGTPEEGRRIQRLKRCISTNYNKDEDSSPKNQLENKKKVWENENLYLYLAFILQSVHSR